MPDAALITRLQKLNLVTSTSALAQPYRTSRPEITCQACGQFQQVEGRTVQMGFGCSEYILLCVPCWAEVCRPRCAICKSTQNVERESIRDAHGFYMRIPVCARCASNENMLRDYGRCQLANVPQNNERITPEMMDDELLRKEREKIRGTI